MKCEICGAENPPSMNHTSMHTCICVDCCRDQKPEWQKRAEEAEVELAKALAEIEQLKHQLEDESMRADGMTTAHAEAGAKNYRQQELIEQMREALRLALPEARSTHCEQTILAALAAERASDGL